MRAFVICVTLAIAASLSYAQEEVKASKEYTPLAKGNFWEYKVKESFDEEEQNGKMELTEKLGEGRFQVTSSRMGSGAPSSLEFFVEGDFFCWKMQEGPMSITFKMLKFGAKKGDSWTSAMTSPFDPQESATLNSSFAAVEEVTTPAGTFKDCLKITHTLPAERNGLTMWFAKGVGLVKFQSGMGERIRSLWLLTKCNIVRMQSEQISNWLKECETALLVEVTAVTDVKPEKEGEPVTKNNITAKIEKSLKGKSAETQLELELSAGLVKTGKFILFLKKVEKGETIVGEPVPADEKIIKLIDEILNPPKFTDCLAAASVIVAGKTVTLEDRSTFKYYVVEVIKCFKGEKTRDVDVLKAENLDLENDKVYLFALKPTVVSGRNYLEPVKSGAVIAHGEEVEKEVETALGKK